MINEDLQAHLAAEYASTSWQITTQLRLTEQRKSGRKIRLIGARRLAGSMLRQAASITAIRRLAIRLLAPFPLLQALARKAVAGHEPPIMRSGSIHYPKRVADISLSRPAREILADLYEAKRKAP
jgi:hypothetical protein